MPADHCAPQQPWQAERGQILALVEGDIGGIITLGSAMIGPSVLLGRWPTPAELAASTGALAGTICDLARRGSSMVSCVDASFGRVMAVIGAGLVLNPTARPCFRKAAATNNTTHPTRHARP